MTQTEIKMTMDQETALESMNEWLYKKVENADDCLFSLTGSAGTGKTTLVKNFIDSLNYPYKSRVCVSAPTHKAKKVISFKSGCDESSTVQALLGLKPDLDLAEFDVNNPTFSATNQKLMNNFRLIIIDEASMVNADLFQVIVEEAASKKTKILFIGDLKQLPPIKEEISLTLSKPVYKYNLTQVVRQEVTNPLINLLECLRNDIDHGTDNYKRMLEEYPISINDKGEGYEVLSVPQDAGTKLGEYFVRASSLNDKNHVRFIAWTNDCIQSVNKYIRDKGFKFTIPLNNGETLLAYKTLIDDQDNVRIVNSEDYIVNSITERIDHLGIKVWVCELKCIDTDMKTMVNIVIPLPDNYETYLIERQDLLNTALAKRGKAWKAYYAFRNSYCLLESLVENKKVIDGKDLDYGYGITIHKSQGSTYENVFVHGKDINQMVKFATSRGTEALRRAELDCKKLWYVALSRASHKAYIIY